MAPGLPCFIGHSSGTLGGTTKQFAKYRHPGHVSLSSSEAMRKLNPPTNNGRGKRGKSCIIFSLGYRQVVVPLNEDGDVEGRILVCMIASGVMRVSNDIVVERHAIYSTMKVPNSLAVSFIQNDKSFLFMHALSALVVPKLDTISTLFTTTCRDLCRAILDQWNDFIRRIETGVIPGLEGIDHVKDNLRHFLQPNSDHAEELRRIGKAVEMPRWLRQIRPEPHSLLLQNV